VKHATELVVAPPLIEGGSYLCQNLLQKPGEKELRVALAPVAVGFLDLP